MMWREKRWLLIGLGVVLLANVIFFFTYRVQYEQRVKDMDATLDQSRARLAAVQMRKGKAELTLAAFDQMSRDISTVYEQWWSSPQRRLADLLIELNQLERRSSLSPRSTSYQQTASEKKGFGNTAMSIAFSVQGTYPHIRQLINLLELSRHFVIIDSITIGNASANGDTLNLNLQLKTLFHTPEGQTDTAAPVTEGGT